MQLQKLFRQFKCVNTKAAATEVSAIKVDDIKSVIWVSCRLSTALEHNDHRDITVDYNDETMLAFLLQPQFIAVIATSSAQQLLLLLQPKIIVVNQSASIMFIQRPVTRLLNNVLSTYIATE